MSYKIPIKTKILGSSIDEEILLCKFMNGQLFIPKTVNKNYFSLLVASILKKNDPLKIINNYIPEIDGELYVDMIIDSKRSEEGVFVHYNEINDDDFEQESNRFLENLKEKLSKRIKPKSQYNFISNFLSTLEPSLENSHLLFLRKDYKNALVEYSKLSKKYPELSRRMCGICKLEIGVKPDLDPILFDILILYELYDELFEISEKLPFDAKVAIQYYLIEKKISDSKRMVLLYSCFQNFKKMSEYEKAKECFFNLLNMVDCYIERDNLNSNFWIECKKALKEREDGLGNCV